VEYRGDKVKSGILRGAAVSFRDKKSAASRRRMATGRPLFPPEQCGDYRDLHGLQEKFLLWHFASAFFMQKAAPLNAL
jgi:hypothetical protein